MRVTQPGGQFWNQAMQVTSPDDPILNQFATNQKCMLKRNTNLISRNIANLKLNTSYTSYTSYASGTIWRANLELMQVAPSSGQIWN